MRRTWVKFYCDQWLRGSIRNENIEVRAIFADLLAMAGDNAYGEDGLIQLAKDVGFNDALIAGILNVPLKTWTSTKERLSNHPDTEENRIELISLHQGFAIKILKWGRYQSEYQRQKTYRLEKKKESTPQTPLKENNNKERDIDIEEKVTKVTGKVTKKVTQDITAIIEHWNSKGMKILEDRESRVKEKTIQKIKNWLNDYSLEEMKGAIDNYLEILKSEDHYFSHQWQLWEFLDRGLTNFLSKNNPFDNWLKSNKDYKPSQIGKNTPIKYTEEEKKILVQIDAEYKKELKKAMQKEGWQSEEEIDYFKVPSLEEYRKKKLKDFKQNSNKSKRAWQ